MHLFYIYMKFMIWLIKNYVFSLMICNIDFMTGNLLYNTAINIFILSLP